MTTYQKIKKSEIKLGKYNAGLPFVSESYNKKTPKTIKIIGETCLFVGSAVAIIAGACTLPGWIVVVGGVVGLAGRHIAKSFSE